MQRKHNLYRDSMVMHNSDPNLHLLGEGIPIDWAEEHGGQPEAEPAADKRRRAKQVVSVIQDDEGALPYEAGAEGLLPPSSPEPAVPPGSPGEVAEIRELLAEEGTEEAAGSQAEERLTNGTHGRRQSGATEEVVAAGSVPGDSPPRGAGSDGDGARRDAPVAPASGAGEPSGDKEHPPTASPAPPAEIPAGDKEHHVTAASPTPGAGVPAGDKGHPTGHPTAPPPAPGAEIPSGAEEHHPTAPPAPAGTDCPQQPSDKETGEEVAPPAACSPPEPAGTTESVVEGVQTEF